MQTDKNQKESSERIIKGGPSGIIISLLVHAGAFLLAGLLVVFTVVQKEEKKFEPPKPVERPKMKLKKPKVKVKKNVKPKSTTRIVTKIQKADMPDLQLPELGGMGTGLEGGAGLGGFGMMPDLSTLGSRFGRNFTTGSDFKGTFYNLNRDRKGRKIPMSPEQFELEMYKFVRRGWKPSTLGSYYRSPNPLFTQTICIPTILSKRAPEAFGEMDSENYCWAVIYRGDLVYPEDITFRFWGVGFPIMAVNVNNEEVFFCAWFRDVRAMFSNLWDSDDICDNAYYFGESRARPSDWITLKAGEPQKMKVLLADTGGGLFSGMLSVEVKGEEYPHLRTGGGPTFPIFRTGELSHDEMDVIYSDLYIGDATLTNGPIFRDYFASETKSPVAEVDVVSTNTVVEKTGISIWTKADGTTFEAIFRTVMGKDAVFENAKGKQARLPLADLSAGDREYLDLSIPIEFDLNFSKVRDKIPNPPEPPWTGGISARPLIVYDYVFGATVKQTLLRDYNHELQIEYFAVGEEVDGNNYVLLGRKCSSFIPTKENRRTHSFKGDPVRIRKMAYRDVNPMRGIEYGGFLITVTDKRGKIIAHKASHEFLFEQLENLKKLKVWNHFNKEGKRVFPPRPTEDNRGTGATDGELG